jgi:hypothetical protein
MGDVIRGIYNRFFDISINIQKNKVPSPHAIEAASEPGPPQYQDFIFIHRHIILVRKHWTLSSSLLSKNINIKKYTEL